jgi:hypothetical protein
MGSRALIYGWALIFGAPYRPQTADDLLVSYQFASLLGADGAQLLGADGAPLYGAA